MTGGGNVVEFPLMPDALARRLTRIAEERGVTLEEVLREAVELFVQYDEEKRGLPPGGDDTNRPVCR